MGKNRKKFSQKYYKCSELPASDLQDDDSEINPEDIIRRINDTKADVKSSQFYRDSLSTIVGVQERENQLRKIDKIICFGLGHFSQCVSSRTQLCFISQLKEDLSVDEILFQDPIFSLIEKEILEKLRFSVIPGNLEGKFIVNPGEICLFYLPHCPKQLTNNFLWANWGPTLSKILLISNAFSGVLISQSKASQEINAGLILKAEEFTEEIPLKNSYIFTDIFNDTALHHFPEKIFKEKFLRLWKDKGPEPIYSDPEFITSSLNRLNIGENVNEKISSSPVVQYILTEFRKNKTTDETLCKAKEELHFMAETYLCYLQSQRKVQLIRTQYSGRGERTISDTANLVGFKLPHDPK
ncbi:Protein FMC1 homolog [Sergentomyia squamirostris]